MIAYLDRQHAGKPFAMGDRGADCNGHVEAMLTPIYLLAIERRLLSLGHDVVTLSDGAYHARHARVVEYARDHKGRNVYIAAHLNAGGGNYGAAFYDHRSSMGKAAAAAVVVALHDACPELMRARSIEASPGDWTRHAYNTISGVYAGRPCGLCLEPAFIDSQDHKELLTTRGLDRMGVAIADGLHQWSQA